MDGKNTQGNGSDGRVGITQTDCVKAVQYTSAVGTFATLLYVLTKLYFYFLHECAL